MSLGKRIRKMPVGTVFEWGGRMWKRGRGIIYVAHPCRDKMIERGYRKREARRQRRWGMRWK